MSNTLTISIGDTYEITTESGEIFTVTVAGMSTKNVSMMASGETVKNPEQTRILPIAVFAEWIAGAKHRKINH